MQGWKRLPQHMHQSKLCSRGQISSSEFILGCIDWGTECFWLEKEHERKEVEVETWLDAGSVKAKAKAQHEIEKKGKEEFIVGLWELVHEYQVKANRGLKGFSQYTTYIHLCVVEKKKSGAEFFVVQEVGEGRTWMFQRPSQMWLMLSLLERTQPCTLWDTQRVCVHITHQKRCWTFMEVMRWI